MPLVAGTRLGPYEVVSHLGAGGMGEVYRARDYRDGERLLSVPVETRPVFRAVRPRTLFARHYQRSQAPRIQTYDAAPDGRLMMIKGSDDRPDR